MTVCVKCHGTGRAEDYFTATVEAAAAYERFYGGHNRPLCGRCKGTGLEPATKEQA